MAGAEPQLEIVAYRPEWREDFARLNREWLERYFSVEEFDERMFADPEALILAPGGGIFFARTGDRVIGTIAILRDSPGVHELAKMAVTPDWQGRGVGRMLVEAAIAFHRERGGSTLFLETNSAMLPAMALYRRMGFVRQPDRKSDSHYARSNVYMILEPPA